MSRSSCPVFCKKVILKYFGNFLGKHLQQSLFLSELYTDLRGFHLNYAKFLTILTGRTVFYSVQYKDGRLTASDLFDVFTHASRVQMFGKFDSSNKTVKMNSCSFQQVLRQNLSWFLS